MGTLKQWDALKPYDYKALADNWNKIDGITWPDPLANKTHEQVADYLLTNVSVYMHHDLTTMVSAPSGRSELIEPYKERAFTRMDKRAFNIANKVVCLKHDNHTLWQIIGITARANGTIEYLLAEDHSPMRQGFGAQEDDLMMPAVPLPMIDCPQCHVPAHLTTDYMCWKCRSLQA